MSLTRIHHAAYNVPLEQLSIVVLDDIVQMAQLFKVMFNAVGIRAVRTYNEPKLMFEQCRLDPPHIPITDLSMPPINGLDLVRLLRHQDMEPLCDLAIIIASAHATPENVQAAVEVGANAFLAKPVSAKTILGTVDRIRRDPRRLSLIENRYVLERTPGAVAEDESASDDRQHATYI